MKRPPGFTVVDMGGHMGGFEYNKDTVLEKQIIKVK